MLKLVPTNSICLLCIIEWLQGSTITIMLLKIIENIKESNFFQLIWAKEYKIDKNSYTHAVYTIII